MKRVCISLLLACIPLFARGKSVFADTFSDEETLGLVEKVISNANDDLTLRNIRELALPDSAFNYILLSGQSEKTVFGDLPTLRVQGENQIVNRTDRGGRSRISFDVTVGIKDFHLSYDCAYRFLHFFRASGRSTIRVGDNRIRLIGELTIYPSGTCHATLLKATISQLDGYQINMTPEGRFHAILAHVIQFLKNHFTFFEIRAYNNLIAEQLNSQSFQSMFSDVACHSFGY